MGSICHSLRMGQPQRYTGTIRLLSAPRSTFSQIDCFGRGAAQVVGSLFLRSCTLMPVRTRNAPKREAWLRSACTFLLGTSRSTTSIHPPSGLPVNLVRHADAPDQFGMAWVAVDRSSHASIAAGLFGCTRPSQLRSTSTATERCSRLTDRTSFIPDLILTMIPVMPRRGPSSILATLPTCRYGQGIVERPFFTTR